MTVDIAKGITRADAGLSIDQILDKAMSQPGAVGIVRGTTGVPSARSMPSPDHPQLPLIGTDFPFRVQKFVGKGSSPYAAGKTITLRIPGGTIGTQGMWAEDAPQVSAGEELYVFVQDLSPFDESHWGQDSDTLLVASDNDDVFEVRGGVVHGQGLNTSLAEPAAVFEQHFAP